MATELLATTAIAKAAGASDSVRVKTVQEVHLNASLKVEALIKNRSYQAPSVTSFLIGGTKVINPLYMGNQ